ncbi:MAG: hypothetical protein ACRDVD_08060 [Acidimicrobiia bacterium]
MTFSQIITAEPWTPGSILAAVVMLAMVVGVIVWRVRRSDD